MKFTARHIWQLYMAIPIFHSFTYASERSKFKRHLNDTIRLSRRYNTMQKIPLMSCCVLCHSDERCNGVSYQQATQTCELNDRSSFYDVVNPETDGAWEVYTKMNAASIGDLCESDEDCKLKHSNCIFSRRSKYRSRCVCNDKYKFVEENHTCAKECESYGTTFTLYPGKYIQGLDRGELLTESFEECRDLCLSLDDDCRSFVMKSGNCEVKSLNLQRAIDGQVLKEKNGSDLYNRDC